ncbi:hypothetical protein [Moorena sp. SIO3B2]|uniref:hypothetical protein n=1 Tax=Moorena sp. SIO3B2 TaxID=2607827 RepID=UPI0013CCFA00|nr:hypothetical protein [Moorena sp. SIO3B2]NEP35268.1 hypothetical protein [Moorena sp. SIO3B2]
MAELGGFSARFMDVVVILAPTRWKLRKAIKAVNQVMNDLQVEKHPDKTFIGPIARGFDFLGYFFCGQGLRIAKKTIERMLDKISRLDEQGADVIRIEKYVRRWWQWVKGGVDGLVDSVSFLNTAYVVCVRFWMVFCSVSLIMAHLKTGNG